jgi:hypothetical protein
MTHRLPLRCADQRQRVRSLPGHSPGRGDSAVRSPPVLLASVAAAGTCYPEKFMTVGIFHDRFSAPMSKALPVFGLAILMRYTPGWIQTSKLQVEEKPPYRGYGEMYGPAVRRKSKEDRTFT